jgi:hypothetical protein
MAAAGRLPGAHLTGGGGMRHSLSGCTIRFDFRNS